MYFLSNAGVFVLIFDPESLLSSSYIRFLVVGLDNAGKTTLITYLSKKRFTNPRKTNGMQVSRWVIGPENLPVMFLDLGGARAFQVTLWKGALDSLIAGIIYVVDSSAFDRYEDQQVAFTLILENKAIQGTPILIVANKIDLVKKHPSAPGELALALQLIEAKINQPEREISLIPISVKEEVNINDVVEWIYRVAKSTKH